MMDKFKVVIFKNKIKKKVIKEFKSLDTATRFFEKIIVTNKNIVFNKVIENGVECNYNILIIGPYSHNKEFYIKDEFGKNVRIYSELKDFSIYQISEYKIEEQIYHVNKNKKLNLDYFINKFIDSPSIKCVSKLNNKIIHQQDEDINIFSCKSVNDCDRFFNILEKYVHENSKMNCILVRDFDCNQKKYLYSILNDVGISKKFLYRRSTTHLK